MKAAVLHTIGREAEVTVDEVDVPVPTPTQVLVKVAACGVCGHDQADRFGLTPVKTPVILGHEISGVVVEVGAQVRGFAVDDRVAAKQTAGCGICRQCRIGQERDCSKRRFNYGGWAEYVVLEATSLLLVPDEVDLRSAAVVSCVVGSTLQALEQVARVRPGEWVAVTGASGGLGRHGLKVAKAFGARTIALTSSAEKAGDPSLFDSDAVVLAQGKDYWQELSDISGGGPQVVLDTIGVPEVFGVCFRALAKRGRYVFMGQLARERVEFFPAFVFMKEAVISGPGMTRFASFVKAMDLVAAGSVIPAVREYALADVAAALEDTDRRRIVGRAILVP